MFTIFVNFYAQSDPVKSETPLDHIPESIPTCDHGNRSSAKEPLEEIDTTSFKKVKDIHRPDLSHFIANNRLYNKYDSLKMKPSSDEPPSKLKVQMKVLFLSATDDPLIEPEIPIAIQSIKAFGIQLDHVVITQNGEPILKGHLKVEEQTNVGKYYAIILSTGQLAFQDKDGKWKSALTEDQWKALEEYEAKYHIRRVSLNTWPASYLGVQLAGSPGAESNDLILAENLGKYSTGMVPGLSSTLLNSWQTPASILDPSRVKPVFYFASKMEGEKPLAAAIINFADQREQMHFFFVQSRYTMPSLIAAPVWLRWATKGVYLGKRRVYLNAQIDDFFLPTDRWDTVNLRQPGDRSRKFRLNPEDLDQFVKYRHDKLISNTQFSDFKIELAFNGIGVWETGGYKKDPIFMASKRLLKEFNWVSHTFTHSDLNLFNYDRSMLEFQKNLEMTKDLFGSIDNRYFSSHSLVSPRISGLFVGGVLNAMVDTQIIYVAGDNTRPEITSENMYVGRWTTKDFNGYDGVLIIPRNATEVYFDTTDASELASEYNNRYKKYFGRDLGYQEIFQREGDRVTRGLLKLEPIAHMFHQSNLRSFPIPETISNEHPDRASLVSLWLDSVLKEYRKYSTLPILSAKFDEIGNNISRRMKYESCGFNGFLSLEDGQFQSFEGSSKNQCEIDLTSDLEVDTSHDESLTTNISSEKYGPDQTYSFQINPHQNIFLNFKPNSKIVK